jgi:putative colanic acid biosynthesis acetyltransferase WcaB
MRNSKGVFFIFFFRLSSFFTRNLLLKIIGFPIRIIYTILIQWLLGIDIPDTTKIGRNLQVFHGQGLVVHKDTIIGKNVILRHNTTIGIAKVNFGVPIIEDNVNVGSNTVIIGPIRIGENSIIGAGSIIVKNIPPNSTVISKYSNIFN